MSNQHHRKRQYRLAKEKAGNHLKKIPKITRYILLAMLLMYILQQFVDLSPLVLHSIGSGFNPIQLFSYAFLHQNLSHLFFNAFAIWMFGTPVEEYLGEKKYLLFVVVCIVSAAITHLLFSNSYVIGISGLDFGLLLAYGMIWPNRQVFLLFPPMPIKAKYMVMGYGVLLLYNIFSSRQDGIAHFAHLGGALGGYLLLQYWNGGFPFKNKH